MIMEQTKMNQVFSLQVYRRVAQVIGFLQTASSTPSTTLLIGTCEERVLLRDEITRQFNEGLESDTEKENKESE